ncbi:MAG: NAD(P)/FAD-dependent oxidoreductase [Paracoccaceae bacterium]
MPFEHPIAATRNIAVIGGGISGMGAALLLGRDHRVTIFEAGPQLGGHARTVIAGRNRDQPVDTGFIVFNHVNYPHLCAMFDELDVPTAKSDMSFGASFDGGRLEYSVQSIDALFAQRRNLVNPAFVRMVRNLVHFNNNALAAADDPSMTVRDLLAKLGMGDWFRDYYLLPFSGAIWSTPREQVLDFPAYAMVRFFKNHALLGKKGKHQWYTVRGGSQEYVSRVTRALEQQGTQLRTSTPVQAVRRSVLGVEVQTANHGWERFDEVIFATHSDDTLRLLADPSVTERDALGRIAYQPNTVTLHRDASIMPKRKRVWSSWSYTEPRGGSQALDLTYWMNSLQPIPKDDPMFVTLNDNGRIRDDLIYDQTTMRHPVYGPGVLEAQDRLREINGTNRTWFCGAWMRNGFHEDGLASAVEVVEQIQSAGAALRVAAQ